MKCEIGWVCAYVRTLLFSNQVELDRFPAASSGYMDAGRGVFR